jgi:hypothetical protein
MATAPTKAAEAPRRALYRVRNLDTATALERLARFGRATNALVFFLIFLAAAAFILAIAYGSLSARLFPV